MSDNNSVTPVVFNVDGLSNAMSGLGTKNDPMAYNKFKQGYLLDKNTLESMYIGNGVAALIVDKLPEEMTKAGFEVEGISEENCKRLMSDIETLDLMREYKLALTFARLYGGAAMLFGLNDGRVLSEPLRKDKIKSIEFIRVFDRYQMSEFSRETNPRDPNFGQVKLWAITPERGPMYLVHHSRLQFFDGSVLPNTMREHNQGWGASCLQKPYEEILRVTGSHDFTLQVLNRIQQAIHGMKNLASTLAAPGGESIVRKRLQTVDMSRSILNTIVVDAEETYKIESQSVSGIKDVLKEFISLLSAVTGYPAFILGQAIGGLNSTGDNEEKLWHSKVKSEQNANMKKSLVFVVDILLSIYGEAATDWEIEFNPLVELSEIEEADVEKKEAETKEIKIRMFKDTVASGFIDKLELKEVLSKVLGVDIKNMPTVDLTPTPSNANNNPSDSGGLNAN